MNAVLAINGAPVETSASRRRSAPSHPTRSQLRLALGLILAVALTGASDLGELDIAGVRMLAAAAVLLVVAPAAYRWWQTPAGFAVVGLWGLCNLSNLVSPMRSVESTFDLTAMFLSVVLVVHVARLVGTDRLRRLLTAYMTVVLLMVMVVRSLRAIASGGFGLSTLRVDTSAAGMWKMFVLISPCPVRWLPARVAFIAFKILLVGLMLEVDRPKIGPMLSVVVALAVGAVVLLLHRRAGRTNPLLLCSMLLPLVALPALAVSNRLVESYGRRSDFSGRTVLWREAIDEFVENRSPLGVGFRNSLTSPEAVDVLTTRFGRDMGINAVHNVYLQVAVELGLVGIALAVIVVATTVVAIARTRSVSVQARLAVDAVFLLGLALSEPILEPSTLLFSLTCLTVLTAVTHARQHAGYGLPMSPGFERSPTPRYT